MFLLFTLVCVGCGGKPARQHYEKAGGFSYNPPDGWEIIEFPGIKYRISRGPMRNGFAPNINVVDETFSGTLSAYVEANLENMPKFFTINFKVHKRGEIKTEDGEDAIFLAIENEQQRRMLRQTFYFLMSGNRKYVVTCTALAEGGEALDSVFEKSVKTFRLH